MKRIIWIGWIASAAALAQLPALRPGISVEMAVTRSAVPMREADLAGARIVAVTRDGTVYWDTTPVTLAALTEEVRAARVARVYVKADARAQYPSVALVLTAIRAAGAGGASLLTSQRDASDGTIVPPKGIEVSLGGVPDSGQKAVALDATGPVPFEDVVRLIDASRSADLRVFLK